MLNIHAKMERKSEDGSRFYQEVSREYLLPETLKVEELKSIFTDDGVRNKQSVALHLFFGNQAKFFKRYYASKRLSRKQRSRLKYPSIVAKYQKRNNLNDCSTKKEKLFDFCWKLTILMVVMFMRRKRKRWK